MLNGSATEDLLLYCWIGTVGSSDGGLTAQHEQMKITFVNTRKEMYPLLGVCYLSAYLKKHLSGIETALVELIFGTDITKSVRKILLTEPDIVGFTTYSVSYHEVVELTRHLKISCPALKIWVGGPHITSIPKTLSGAVDIAVIGEGEETLLELCRHSLKNNVLHEEALSDIKGICFRKGGGLQVNDRRGLIEDIDSIPPPDLSLLDMQWYTKSKRFFVMEAYFRGFVILTSRGCPYDCRFCQAAAQWERCRYHSAERIVTEIEGLRNTYPKINAINIIDDLFIGSRQRLRETVRLIKEKNLHDGLVFNVNGRANLIDDEVLQMLRSINVVQISYGFESGSERILKFLKKNSVSVADNKKAADMTYSYGIGVGGQFMIGTPGETRDEIRQTIDFIDSHRMTHAHLSVTVPLPGTELWKICAAKGLIAEDMDWRTLDFGNPDNPNLIYVNDATIPKDQFAGLLKEAQTACNQWNPKPTWRDYLAYRELLSPWEFVKKAIKKALSLLSHIGKRIGAG